MSLTEIITFFSSAEQGLTDAAKMELRNVLSRLPSRDAEQLYIDLCRIQLAAEDGNAPTLSILHTDDPKHFAQKFLSTGLLVDLVADCIELPEVMRLKKWKFADMESNLAARLHRETTRWLDHYSHFQFVSRDVNRKAHERVRASLSASLSKTGRLQEWQTLLLADLSSLQRQPVPFWNAIQINRCSIDEKRAICHKLVLCNEFQDGKMIKSLHQRIMDDIYLKTYDIPLRKSARTTRRSWFLRHLRIFARRRRHTVAIMKPADSVRFGSSAPALESPRFV